MICPLRHVPLWVRRACLIFLGCAAPGSLGGCGAAPEREPAELRVPLARDIEGLDPAGSGEIVTFNVVRQLYEGLLDYDPKTFEVVPLLAKSWQVSEDGRSWRFELRPGVRFCDDACFPGGRGREVQADDVKFSIERGLALVDGSGRRDLPPLEGLEPFLDGAAPEVAGIVAEAPERLVLRLTRRDPNLPHFLVLPRCRVVAREAVKRYGSDLQKHAVGTGPFRLVSWETLGGILLVRNSNYWRLDSTGARLPYVDAVSFVPFWTSDDDRLFAAGRIDMVYSYVRGLETAAPAARSGGDGPEVQQFFVPRLNTVFARFDERSRHPMVKDRRLREVLSLALERPRTSHHLPARGLFPPGLPGYDPDLDGQRTDLEEARERFARLAPASTEGWPALRVASREWDAGVATNLVERLEALGIRAEANLYADREYWGAVREGRADLFRDGWMADYPDPENFLQLFYSGAAENRGFYRNPEYDRLYRMLSESQGSERLALARRMERMLIDDAAALFVKHERESQFVSARVMNWEENCTSPLNVNHYELVRLRPGRW